MTRNLLALAVLLFGIASEGWSQSDRIIAWFEDGAGVEIGAESTGTLHAISSTGGGLLTEDRIYRFVTDAGSGVVVFAYEVEASQSETSDSVSIRIRPISPKIESLFVEHSKRMFGVGRLPSGKLPTVARAWEFPAVRRGEAVKLDILHNPETNETIYDVLTPTREVNRDGNGRPAIWAIGSRKSD